MSGDRRVMDRLELGEDDGHLKRECVRISREDNGKKTDVIAHCQDLALALDAGRCAGGRFSSPRRPENQINAKNQESRILHLTSHRPAHIFLCLLFISIPESSDEIT